MSGLRQPQGSVPNERKEYTAPPFNDRIYTGFKIQEMILQMEKTIYRTFSKSQILEVGSVLFPAGIDILKPELLDYKISQQSEYSDHCSDQHNNNI